MHRLLPLALLLVLIHAPLSARADTSPDLAFTDFAGADINSLAGGQVLQQRGGLISFQRGLTAQSVYIIDAAPGAVQQKLDTWNPGRHSELQVWMHLPLPAHPGPGDFSGLASLPDNSSVKNLIDATQKLDPSNPSLQVSSAEAQQVAAAARSSSDPHSILLNAWGPVLLGRIGHFLSGNIGGEEYQMSDGNISSLSEMTSLFRSDPRIYQRYHPLLVQTPIYKSTKLAPANLYYESFDVEGTAAIGTGAIYQTQLNGAPATGATSGPILSADLEYFVNYGIYVSVELEQLSPVTVNGRTETLVWRTDMVSTSNVAYLHGTERLASGMIMLQDVKQAVDAFRSEFK